MEVNIEDSWKRRLQPEFDKPYFYNLTNFVKEEYSKHTIYPPGKFIFHAFNTCPFDKDKSSFNLSYSSDPVVIF